MEDDGHCADGDCSTGVTCFRHKLRSIQFTPSCTPTRRNTIPPRTPQNSWERGVATDNRGMPLLDSNMEPIGLKELANNRSTIEGALKDLKNKPVSA
jgi:hypothetical protein